MKFLLAYLLFTSSHSQGIVFNTLNHQFYVFDVTASPIQIFVIQEDMILPISCLHNQAKQLNEVNFSNSPSCLMTTLNEQFDFKIDHYVDLKHLYTQEELIQMKKNPNLNTLLSVFFQVSHSYDLPELYDIYKMANKNEFQYEIHSFIYLKIDNKYIPLSYAL